MRVRKWAPIAAVAIAVVVTVAMVSPALRSDPRDGYPLSTYPMFADDIGRTTAIDVAYGLSRDGERITLSPELITGTGEVILAVATVSNAVAAGDSRAADLCEDIAARVGRSRTDVAEVQIATERYDAVAYFDGHHVPQDPVVHATCPVR